VTPEDARRELGVAATATWATVKREYRKHVQDTHSDHNPDNPEKRARFERITAAYEVLSLHYGHAKYDPGGIKGEASEWEAACVAALNHYRDLLRDIGEAQAQGRLVRRIAASAEQRARADLDDLNDSIADRTADLDDLSNAIAAEDRLYDLQDAITGARPADPEPPRRRRGLLIGAAAAAVVVGGGVFLATAPREHPAPQILSVTMDQGGVGITWADTTGETGYLVTARGSNIAYVQDIGANATTARWPLPDPGERFCFHVRAYRDPGAQPADWSDVLRPWQEDAVAPWSPNWIPPWPETWTSDWSVTPADDHCVTGPDTESRSRGR
jgi:hypothetical protein